MTTRPPAGELCTSHSGTRPRRTDVHRDRTAAYQDAAAQTTGEDR